MEGIASSTGYIPLRNRGDQDMVGMALSRNAQAMATANGSTIDKTSKDFEAMFMAQMLQPMFESVEVDGLFGGGHGEEVMRGLLVQEYGKSLAANSNSMISDAVKSEMLRAQEHAGKISSASRGTM